MSFKCPWSVSDSKLPFMCGSVQPISMDIGGFGSPWKGPPAPPDMRAPLCLSQADLPSLTQKGVSSPSSLPFLSSSLFFLSIFSLRFHFNPDIQGPQLTPVLIYFPLPTGSPLPQTCSSLVLFVFSTTTDIYLLVLYCYSQFLYTI